MRKTIVFGKPITIDQDGNKLTVESLSGEIRYAGDIVRFRPDIMDLQGYIDFEIPEQEEQQIRTAISHATIQRRVVKTEDIKEPPELRK